MVDHWKANGPPVYISVAAYLGFNKPEDKKGDLGELLRMFESSGGMIEG